MLILLAILASPPAHAQDFACTGIAQLKDDVYSCESNANAAIRAEQCYDVVMKNWDAASQELAKIMARRKAVSAQNKLLDNMDADFRNALEKIRLESESMQRNTDLVSSYLPELVHFYPGIADPSQTHCYVRPYQRIQEIVAHLDQQILLAKKLSAQTGSFQKITQRADSNLDGLGKGRLPASTAGAAGTPVPKGTSPRSASDITGTQRKPEKSGP